MRTGLNVRLCSTTITDTDLPSRHCLDSGSSLVKLGYSHLEAAEKRNFSMHNDLYVLIDIGGTAIKHGIAHKSKV